MDDLEQIEKHWWWRHLEFADYCLPEDKDCDQAKWYQTIPKKNQFENLGYPISDFYQQWKTETELPAWRYELLRRRFGPDWLKPFPWVSPNLLGLILGTFGERKEPVAQIVVSGTIDNDNFSEPFPPYQFDLTASNSSLIGVFLHWVASQRNAKGLPENTVSRDKKGHLKTFSIPPSNDELKKSKGSGGRKRSVVWRWVELQDLKAIGRLNYNDTKIFEQANRECSAMKGKFQRMLKSLDTLNKMSPDLQESTSHFIKFLKK